MSIALPSGRASTPRRAAGGSRAPRGSGVVLVVGSALAAAAVFGPPALARAGVAAAVLTAILAWASAWGELRAVRRQLAQDLLTADRVAAQVLREERRRNAVVVDALTVRGQEAAAALDRQAESLAVLRGHLARVRSDRAQVETELGQREATIARLHDTVRAREAELLALRSGGDDAEVHPMPRRVRTEPVAAGEAGEVAALRRGPDAVIMPNYEVDRRLA